LVVKIQSIFENYRSLPSQEKNVFKDAFKVFDKDGNGKISAEELRSDGNFRSILLSLTQRIANGFTFKYIPT